MDNSTPRRLTDAFAFCARLTRAHYENFPVASLLLPGDLRPYVYSIYAFARTADDFSDEGVRPAGERLRLLDDWERQLNECYQGKATHPIFIALAETVAQKSIPKQPLSRLLQAFRMDVTKNRFDSFEDLLFYCRHSANPVGQLVLYVFGKASADAIAHSDAICTGLQLTNFWQDLSIDLEKGRLYVPLEDLDRFGYTEKDLQGRNVDHRFRSLMRWEVERARAYLISGTPLLPLVDRRLRFELDLTIRGGLGILRKMETGGYNVYARRPALTLGDKLGILLKAAFQQRL
jgi:squalene synthase HpnC